MPTQTDRSKGAFGLPLLVLALAQLGTSTDSGAFSVATSEILQVFGCSVADVQLASTVYSLVAGALMLASGLLGLVAGWRRTFRLGLSLAAVGELFCALAPGIQVLIWAGRVLVGLGASLIIPSVLGMVSLLYEGRARKQAYGVIAAAAALTTLVSILFGVLIDVLGFRITFGVLAAYFIVLVVASGALPAGAGERGARFDVPGALLTTAGLLCIMCGLSRISVWGVVEPLPGVPFTVFGISPALPLVGLGLVILVLLVPLERWMERTRGVAVLPRVFLKSPQARAGMVAIALPFFFQGAQGIVATSFYQLVVGMGATTTALLGIISGIPMIALAMMIPRSFPQANPWAVVRAGYLCLAVAAGMMAVGVRMTTLSAVMIVATLLGGVGVGLVNSQANNLVASAVPARASQQSGGIQGASRNLGLALGTAAMGSVLLVAMNSGLTARIQASAGLDGAAREVLSETVYTYESDAAFRARVESAGVTGDGAHELLAQNAATRADAGSLAMGTVAGLSLLALLTTRPRAASEARDGEEAGEGAGEGEEAAA